MSHFLQVHFYGPNVQHSLCSPVYLWSLSNLPAGGRKNPGADWGSAAPSHRLCRLDLLFTARHLEASLLWVLLPSIHTALSGNDSFPVPYHLPLHHITAHTASITQPSACILFSSSLSSTKLLLPRQTRPHTSSSRRHSKTAPDIITCFSRLLHTNMHTSVKTHGSLMQLKAKYWVTIYYAQAKL